MSVAIGLGLMEFPFSGAGDYWRWVDLCEAGGVDSLWQTDRLVSQQPILECMAIMAALAGRTRRLNFGVNVVSLALRDPVLLAKQCATIDVLSEGRLLPAFGIGSPLGPEWTHAQPRHQDARPQDRRGARDHRPAVARGQRRFRRACTITCPARRSRPSRCSPTCRCGSAARPRPRSGARRSTAPAGRPAARRLEDASRVVAAIKKAAAPRPAARSTTTITAPASRSASAAPTIRRRPARSTPTPSAPAATPSGYFAIGDAGAIVDRIAEYVAVGI